MAGFGPVRGCWLTAAAGQAGPAVSSQPGWRVRAGSRLLTDRRRGSGRRRSSRLRRPRPDVDPGVDRVLLDRVELPAREREVVDDGEVVVELLDARGADQHRGDPFVA